MQSTRRNVHLIKRMKNVKVALLCSGKISTFLVLKTNSYHRSLRVTESLESRHFRYIAVSSIYLSGMRENLPPW